MSEGYKFGLGEKKILIIDDDPEFRAILKKILKNLGAEVHEAFSVQQGLDLMKSKTPHLIMLDLVLHDESGMDFLTQLKNHQSWDSIPLITMSSSNDRENILKSYELGAVDFLVKPIKSTTVLQKIKSSLKDYRGPKVEFDKKEQPRGVAHFDASIVKISEDSLYLESPLKLSSSEKIYLKSDLLKKIGGELIYFCPTKECYLDSSGRYLGKISFRGIDENFAKSVRKLRTSKVSKS